MGGEGFLALILFFLCFQAFAATEDWVISGQSNAVRLISSLPLNAPPIMNAEGIPIRIAGSAYDGQSIKVWTPGQQQWTPMQRDLEAPEDPVDVFLWYQGEENGFRDKMTSDQYLDSLKLLVSRVRQYGRNPDMTVVICQVGNVTTDTSAGKTLYYPPIRDAHRRFVTLDTNALLLPNMGRSLSDMVHLNPAGMAELSGDISRALLKFRHGKESDWPGPVLDGAVVNGTDGIIAHFAEVRHLSGFNPLDFALIDPDSLNPCTSIVDSGNTRVSLRFQRPVKQPARLVYGPKNAPPADLRDEAGYRAPYIEIPVTTGTVPDKPTFAPNGAANRFPILNDTLPITSFQVYAQDPAIEPYLSTTLTAVAVRSTGRVDTVTAACGFFTLDRTVAFTRKNSVIGNAMGTARIRVWLPTPSGTLSDTISIQVNAGTAILDSLRLSLDSMELMPGDSFKLRARAYYHQDAVTFTRVVDTEAAWSSSDAGTATVSRGHAVGRGEGSALISASLNGKADTCRFSGYMAQTRESLLITQVPQGFSTGANAMGTIITFAGAGRIAKARIYAAANDSGLHMVRIWRMANSGLAAGPFRWEFRGGAAGWKSFALPNPVIVAAGERMMVDVSTPLSLPYTSNGFAAPVVNGSLTGAVGAGVYATVLGTLPAKVYGNQNYFRDVVFVPGGGSAVETADTLAVETGLCVRPNPFNPVLALTLPQMRVSQGAVHLMIYDMRGQLAADLSEAAARNRKVIWDAQNRSSGVYLVEFSEGPKTLVRRIVLQK